ncbi:hypothetical protein CODIS_03470 [Candidatus Thiodiazotropha endolucinida]|uniref:Uncharacterized protein n=1 Tax=Candidatus Thiodiazotropha endolucinida TaxID=1655433 RepID=A0A7Z1AH57_9GAMM|nr:hypothetical protein CODIS_03470 [Candidatus Thiodiazotropha endolucinida]
MKRQSMGIFLTYATFTIGKYQERRNSPNFAREAPINS